MPSDPPEALQDQLFDYKKAAAELCQGEVDGGRKLTLFDQCQAFAVLRNRAPTRRVALAFGITNTAAAQIKGCLKSKRYRAVKREFEALGEELFMSRYYTAGLFDRLARVKHNVDGEAHRFNRSAPNRKADSKSIGAIGTFEVCPGEFWQVNFVGARDKPETAGWRFAYCQRDGTPMENETRLLWKGQEAISGGAPRPFRTSGYAYNAAFRYCNMDPPR